MRLIDKSTKLFGSVAFSGMFLCCIFRNFSLRFFSVPQRRDKDLCVSFTPSVVGLLSSTSSLHTRFRSSPSPLIQYYYPVSKLTSSSSPGREAKRLEKYSKTDVKFTNDHNGALCQTAPSLLRALTVCELLLEEEVRGRGAFVFYRGYKDRRK